MATIRRGNSDEVISELKRALDTYESDHPGADADLYRENPASVRVRVIDQRFAPMNRSSRHEDLWRYLASHVSEETLADVSLLLPIAPAEMTSSLANLEFEDPSPSGF